jgi:hypothetical protein
MKHLLDMAAARDLQEYPIQPPASAQNQENSVEPLPSGHRQHYLCPNAVPMVEVLSTGNSLQSRRDSEWESGTSEVPSGFECETHRLPSPTLPMHGKCKTLIYGRNLTSDESKDQTNNCPFQSGATITPPISGVHHTASLKPTPPSSEHPCQFRRHEHDRNPLQLAEGFGLLASSSSTDSAWGSDSLELANFFLSPPEAANAHRHRKPRVVPQTSPRYDGANPTPQ